jgi:hypothetical protein
MPRESHEYLTDATRDTLKENVKAVADAWDVTDRYIYLIIGEERGDPMHAAAFFDHYGKLRKRGVSTDLFDRELAYLREKHAKGGASRDVGEAMKDKYHVFSQFFEKLMQSMADGTLDAAETDDLLDILAVLEPLMQTGKQALLAHKAKLEVNGERKTENGK